MQIQNDDYFWYNNYLLFLIYTLSETPEYAYSSTTDSSGILQQQPMLSASSIYQTKTMVLENDIKNLIILIPNEGHEPSPDYSQPPPEELRVINQPYIPENAVVNVGTTLTWFNADAGHPHIITLVDNSFNDVIYDSGEFEEFIASSPITLNDTGAFSYSGPSFADEFRDFAMEGTLTVVNQPTSTFAAATNASNSGAATNSGIDTVTTLMVPASLVEEITSELEGQGFGIDNRREYGIIRSVGNYWFSLRFSIWKAD